MDRNYSKEVYKVCWGLSVRAHIGINHQLAARSNRLLSYVNIQSVLSLRLHLSIWLLPTEYRWQASA